MRIRNKMFTMAISMTVLSAAIMTGCAAAETGGTAMAEKGFLTLSVNPEIQIEYNKDGKVTALTGQNDDGIKILKEYPDYVGKDCEAVIKDLIVEINEAGYFVEDIDGNTKNIVLQLEPGSVLPDDDFLEDMTSSTQNAIKDLNLGSGIVTIDDDDYDPAYAKEGKPSHYITLEKAQEIALTQAGISAADAVFEDKEFDHDDGTPVFELEFEAAGQEFEYDIHAVTGKVIRAEHQSFDEQNDDYNDTDYGPENDGVTDYNDTDYGPENDGVTDYNDTDYGPENDGVTDYNDTDYGPENDGVTDYNDTDYGPENDGVTDYNDTDYGPENDGVTDYNDNDDGVSNYDDSNDDQDDGVSNYDDNSDDQDSDDDDDGASDYDD
ncbi:MAG: PepSY domain-containing protein [Lachnospiraceae bacterium]